MKTYLQKINMKKSILKLTAIALSLVLASSSCDKTGNDVDPPQDFGGIEITKNTTWKKDSIYVLSEKTWVMAGATLTIEAGTIIKAESKSDPKDAVALIVTPGSKIIANGTKDEPIVFTTTDDNIDANTTSTLTATSRGKWGGIVLMGRATCDVSDQVNGVSIEGIQSGDTRGRYGTETVDNDNSGILRYVSIRHGGASVTGGSELNGLSLYGVGSGTTLEYIEVFANNDDGIEFFGGVPTMKWALVTHSADDAFDYDQGFSGKGQYWAAIQQDGDGDKGGEFDGGEGDKNPNSVPTIANFTFIGEGTNTGFHCKKSTGGKFYNGIIHNFANGIFIDGVTDADLSFNGIIVSEADATNEAVYSEDDSDLTDQTYVGAEVEKKDLTSISWTTTNNGTADVIPTVADAATTVANPSEMTATTYKGAFDPTATTTWAAGWTRSSELDLID